MPEKYIRRLGEEGRDPVANQGSRPDFTAVVVLGVHRAGCLRADGAPCSWVRLEWRGAFQLCQDERFIMGIVTSGLSRPASPGSTRAGDPPAPCPATSEMLA